MKFTIRQTIEVEIDVDCELTPGEPQTHREPGCPPMCEPYDYHFVPGSINKACEYFLTDEFHQKCFEYAAAEDEAARDEAADNKRKGTVEDA